MAWVSTKEIHRGRSFTGGEKGTRTYKRGWLIQRDSSADTVFQVANTSQLPLPYEPYPEDQFALRLGMDVTPAGDESGVLWEASATYSNQYDSQSSTNPLQMPALYQCASQQYTRPVTKDIKTGQTILNLAGDYYDPAPEVDDSRGIIQVTKNLPTFPLSLMQYVNAINSDSFFNNAPRTWKCNAISSGSLQNSNGYSYYAVTFEFQYNPDTWVKKILEIGYNGKKADGTKIAFKVDKPSLLVKRYDSSNKLVIGRSSDPNDAIFTDWYVYRELPFSVFGFSL